MTEHLPECWATHPSDPPAWCICDELRACEKRVLDAARNALAALRGYIGTDGNGDGTVWVEKFDALSAIYALRKGSETPPPLPPSVGVPERRWT